MRRSLRRMGHQEVNDYLEEDQLFTTESLDEAKERLAGAGRELSAHCFFTWVKGGVRYFRVWEDRRLKSAIAQPVPFGHTAATLKRSDAEKLYIKARRFRGARPAFALGDGLLQVIDPESGAVRAALSLPLTGGALVFEPAGWTEQQAAHFVNVLLVRDQSPEVAFQEAETLQLTHA